MNLWSLVDEVVSDVQEAVGHRWVASGGCRRDCPACAAGRAAREGLERLMRLGALNDLKEKVRAVERYARRCSDLQGEGASNDATRFTARQVLNILRGEG